MVINKTLIYQLVKFGIVGGIGFFVEAFIIYLFNLFSDLNLIIIRFISFPIALLVTWILNRNLTFTSTKNIISEFLKYSTTQILGIFINIFFYSICILSADFFNDFPIMALAVGSGIAMFFNFFVSRFWIFR